MKLSSQVSTIQTLETYARGDRHSILLEGPAGCGKSYLAKCYVDLVGASDFVTVSANVPSIRESLDYGYQAAEPIVYCIENLDIGSASAAYALLKFLEEPVSNVYVIVTCRNRYSIPDTILSRCTTITLAFPTSSDVNLYAESVYPDMYRRLKARPVWRAVKSFSDVSYICRLNDSQLQYIEDTFEDLKFNDSISSLSWKYSHFSDNTEIDLKFAVNLMLAFSTDLRIRRYGIECCKELDRSRVAKHATFSKFLLDCKYGD